MVRDIPLENRIIRLIIGDKIFLLLSPGKWIEFPTELEAYEWLQERKEGDVDERAGNYCGSIETYRRRQPNDERDSKSDQHTPKPY